MTQAMIGADGETMTVDLPITFRKRGGRKRVVTPDGAEWAPRPKVDTAMIKALVRAFRWRKLLNERDVATIRDLAQREKVALSCAARVLQPTFLAPDLVDAILDGGKRADLNTEALRGTLPIDWSEKCAGSVDSSFAILINPPRH